MTRLTDKERIEYINVLNKFAGDLMVFAHEIRRAEKVIRVGPGEISSGIVVHPTLTTEVKDTLKRAKDSTGYPEKSVFYSRCEHKLLVYRVRVQQITCSDSGEVFVG
jgi:hypothetical protein